MSQLKVQEAPQAPKPSTQKIPSAPGATGLAGKASTVAGALTAFGVTSAAARQAIIQTSAKESGLDLSDPAGRYLLSVNLAESNSLNIDFSYKSPLDITLKY